MRPLVNTRRQFLHSGVAAGTALAAAPSAPLLPAVTFGKHRVTRLITGSNPLFGYSHFNRILDQSMRDWMTQDRRLEVLRRSEAAGINTWQFHYSEQTLADLARLRAEGGKLQVFVLGMGEMEKDPAVIAKVAALGPIGIAHHGGTTDDRFRNGEMAVVREFCRRVRDSGVLVGVSTHNPEVVDFIESAGWDIDYYMTCLYRISRTREEARARFGEAPIGEIYMEKDPERMCNAVRRTKRPCLAFKLLGAGRTIGSRQQVEAAFRFAFEHIKPSDAVIVGMFPKYKDEIVENASIVRHLAGPVS